MSRGIKNLSLGMPRKLHATRSNRTSCKSDPGHLRPVVLVGLLLSLGSCTAKSGNKPEEAPAGRPSAPADGASPKTTQGSGIASHSKFNIGYGADSKPDATGNFGGKPNFQQGHTWITKKALKHLSDRNLLPAVLASEQSQNYLYYGTAFSDQPWMSRPEAPNVPVWNPVTKALDAVDDLRNGVPPTSNTCPYNNNCNAMALCKAGAAQCFVYENSPQWSLCDHTELCPFDGSLTYDWLTKNVGKIGAANCTNIMDRPCGSPAQWVKSNNSAYFPSFDGTYGCLRGEDSTKQHNCLYLGSAGYKRDDVTSSGSPFFVGINLHLNANAIVGLGNSYQRSRHFKTYEAYEGGAAYFSYESPGSDYDIQLLERNLPFHPNPAMLFRLAINIGGDGGLAGDIFKQPLTWGEPIVQDSALDNLYHYALADILEYAPSAFGSWGQPHDPSDSEASIKACNDIINNAPGLPIWDVDEGDSHRYDASRVADYEHCLLAVSPYSTSVLGYPFLAGDFAKLQADYPTLKQETLFQLQLQPSYGNKPSLPEHIGYGAAKYGAILYQFARKFFKGSPVPPSISDMIHAGPGQGWETGGSRGATSVIGGANFTPLQVNFPSTNLGGNPFICMADMNSANATDTCATGSPTWPIWVPDQYDESDRDGFLAKLTASNPAQSNRAAAIYLGWAAHMMQDISLPHHASNWSGYQHQFQDDYGDLFAKAEAIALAAQTGSSITLDSNDTCIDLSSANPDDLKKSIEDFDQQTDAILTQMLGSSGKVNWTSADIAAFCSATGLPRDGIIAGSINWRSPYNAFLQQGQTAFISRQPSNDDKCSPPTLKSSYASGIVRNAILGTIKLLLCAPPGDQQLPAPTNLRGTPVDHGVDLAWDAVAGAKRYAVYVSSATAPDFVLLSETSGTETMLPAVRKLTNGVTHSFVVAAKDDYGVEGLQSTPITATPMANPNCAGVSVCAQSTKLWGELLSDGGAMLHWLPAAGVGSYARLYRSSSDDSSDVPIGTYSDMSIRVPAPPVGVANAYTVRLSNSDCFCVESNSVGLSRGTLPLSAPGSFTATPLAQAVDLKWNPVARAAGYIVFMSSPGSPVFSPVAWPAGGGALISNLVNGQTYGFYVVALDAGGIQGVATEVVSATPNPIPGSSAPQLSAVAGDQMVTLTWNAVPGASYYWVWIKMDPGADFNTNQGYYVTSTTGTITTLPNSGQRLTNGMMYYFAVEGANSLSPSGNPKSNVVAVTPNAPCPGVPLCSAHGTCSAGICSCSTGYSGPDCSVTCPNGPTCSGNGTCVKGTCQCQPGYSPPDCSVTCPGGPTCSGHGTCNAGKCTCTPGSGYSGPDCSTTCINGPSCSGHGTCEEGICHCDTGYSSPACLVTCPGGPTCSGHGTCNAGTCSCNPGYLPPDCAVTCPGTPMCSGRGTCEAGQCKCAAGYVGTSCEANCGAIGLCFAGTACSGNSMCASRVCTNGICKSPSCAPQCGQGSPCGAVEDCASRICSNGTCQAAPTGVTDVDGNVYPIVTLGTQMWSTVNLRTTKFNDGTSIPLVTGTSAWASLTTPAYSFYGNTTVAADKAKWGALYNGYAVNTGKLAPVGWHVATDADWTVLQNYLIANKYNYDSSTTGNKIAQSMAAKSDWTAWSGTGLPGSTLALNNRSGFSGLPGGYRFSDGGFYAQKADGYWWSAPPADGSYSVVRNLHYNDAKLLSLGMPAVRGYSVRLVRN